MFSLGGTPMHIWNKTKTVTWTLLIAAVAFAGSASAQILEEVVVTAQKREQNLQDVGIAITAFTGDQLTALGVVESTDIAAMTPGVHLSMSSAGQTRQFTIRGVTQNDFSDHAEAPNAVYIDEGYLASPQAQVFAAFDLERVEILKGPQGTLFGRNATGGLVHFITRKPTDEFEAFGEVQYGEENTVRVEGAVSGPLNDNISARVSGMYNRHDPIMNNIYPFGEAVNPAEAFGGPAWFGSPAGAEAKDFWNDDQFALRGQVLWDLNGNAELLLSGYYAEQNLLSGPYQGRGTTPVCQFDAMGNCTHINSVFASDEPQGCEAIDAATGGCGALALVDGEFFGPGNPVFGPEDGLRPVQGGDLYGYIDPDGNDFDTSTDHIADYNQYKTHGITAKFTFDYAGVDYTSVSHYIHHDKRASLDVDSSPVAQLIVMNDESASSFAQEFRLNWETDRARWVTGFYYLWIDADYNQGLANSPGGPFSYTLFPMIFGNFDPAAAATLLPGGAGELPPLEANTLANLTTNSYSLFGQVDFDLTDTLTVIGGVRGILENKDFVFENNFYINEDDRTVDTNTLIAPGYAPFSDSTSDTLFSVKAELDWRPTEDLLLYASFNRGVKAGSFNAPLNDGAPRLDDSQFGYKEEVLIAYEAGFKSTWLGGTTRVNGSFYVYDYSDYQAFLFQGSAGAIFNNDANYKGIELDVQSSPMDGLDLMFTGSLIDPEIEGLAVAAGVNRDVKPSFTPTAQISILGRYEFQQDFADGRIAIQGDANYASSAYHNIRNYESQKMKGYWLGNARVSWNSNDGLWQTQAFVSNLGDTRYKTTGFDLSTLCGCSEESYGRPRWWGIKVRRNFGGM
jgi:iron complex outermembrane receptor protein